MKKRLKKHTLSFMSKFEVIDMTLKSNIEQAQDITYFDCIFEGMNIEKRKPVKIPSRNLETYDSQKLLL